MRHGYIVLLFIAFSLVSIGLISFLPDASAATYDVDIPAGTSVPGCEEYDGCFIPSTITIKQGDRVVWYNGDTAAHTVTSGSVGYPDGFFDSSLFMAGTSFSVNFDGYSPGEYVYHCMVHPWMVGTVIVQGTSTPTPTGPPITVSTDRSSYKNGDIIRVSGKVSELLSGYQVALQVFEPRFGNQVALQTFGVKPDGRFSTEIEAGGGLWRSDGTYTIKVMYGSQSRTAETTFEFSGSGVPLPKPTPTPSPNATPYTRDTTPPKILQPSDVTIDADDPKGAIVTYDVLVIDDTDRIVSPFCSPSSGSFFSVGDSTITCSATDSSGNRASQVSFMITVIPQGVMIPNWVKNVAEFWCDNKIDDAAFIDGIQYLIDNDIIVVDASQSGNGYYQGIPSWIKNNACWWSQGLISDLDFASGLEYLIQQGIIRV